MTALVRDRRQSAVDDLELAGCRDGRAGDETGMMKFAYRLALRRAKDAIRIHYKYRAAQTRKHGLGIGGVKQLPAGIPNSSIAQRERVWRTLPASVKYLTWLPPQISFTVTTSPTYCRISRGN